METRPLKTHSAHTHTINIFSVSLCFCDAAAGPDSETPHGSHTDIDAQSRGCVYNSHAPQNREAIEAWEKSVCAFVCHMCKEQKEILDVQDLFGQRMVK